MKKFLLGSVALAAMIAGPAMAADMPLKAPPPVVVYSWTGCYVGGHVGGKSSNADLHYGANTFGNPAIVPGTNMENIHMSGALAGAQIGCQYQFAGGWLIGVEGDGSWTQSDGQARESIFFPEFREQVTEHWVATARARLGYGWDKWMFYVTGGGAWAGVELKNFESAFVIAGNRGGAGIQQNTLSGWTVGFGAEYALGYGWSIKGEYLYMDFTESTYFTPTNFFTSAEHRLKLQQSVARFGMNYKFDWGYGPGVARY
jgi:outer membrane immunogenic protein